MKYNILDPLCRAYKKGDPGPPGPAPQFISTSAYGLPYGSQPTLVIGGNTPNLTMVIGVPAGEPAGSGGPGSGNVVGPGSATPGTYAVFADATGKLLAEGTAPFNGIYSSLTGVPTSFAPSAHASRHKIGGSDPIRLDELGVPVGSVNFNGQKATGIGAPSGPTDAVPFSTLDGYAKGIGSSTPGRMAVFSGLDGRQLGQGPVLATVATTGSYADLTGTPAPYVLPSPTDLTTYMLTATDRFVRQSEVPAGGGTGNVVGPSSATVGAVAIYANGTGKVIASGVTLGNVATKNIGTTAGSVAAGDDPRFGLLPEPEVKHLLPYARKTGYGAYDLEYVYGLNWRNGMFQLKDLYQLADAQAKFPKLFSWFIAAGKDNTWIMNMTHYPACHNEAVLQGHVQGNWGTGRIESRNDIHVPVGLYRMNHQAIIDGAKYSGVNSCGSYNGVGGTVLIMDKDNWQGDPINRFLHYPSTLATDHVYFGYLECTHVQDFHYEGLSNWLVHDPSYMSAGLAYFRAGENSTMDRIFSYGFNGYGVAMIGPAPVNMGHISVFSNTFGGLGYLGGALSTCNIDVLSGDDNPALLRVESIVVGSDARSGGSIFIGAMKSESGKRDPQRGQILVHADGHTGPYNNEGSFLNLNVGTIQYDMDGSRVDALFVVNGFTDSPSARGTTSGNRKARINVGSLHARGFESVLHDIDRKRNWASNGDYQPFGFTWNAKYAAAGDSMIVPICDAPTLTPRTVNSSGRLGMITSGTFDYGAGTPAYDETTLVPVNIPSSTFQSIYCAVDRGTMRIGETAQCKAISIDYELRMMAGAPVSWSIVSGPATISGVGVVTPTGLGDVVIQGNGIAGTGICYLKVIA